MYYRKIALLMLFVIIYCLYSAYVKLAQYTSETSNEVAAPDIPPNSTQIDEIVREKVIKKAIPLFVKNGCSVLEIFTKKPDRPCPDKKMDMTMENSITAVGIVLSMIVLSINAVLDVIHFKEEEAKKKLIPDGERRQSLAEFANKRDLRRDSSKFNLFQITQRFTKKDELNTPRPSRPYTRGDSTNSYLSERLHRESSGPATLSKGTDPLVKRPSASKIFGAPTPMLRRSSFPVLPLSMTHQPSVDSDDDDSKGRRIRIIRRY